MQRLPSRAFGVIGQMDDEALAELLDALATRFSRLRDTAGDKLLPVLLQRVGEPVGSALDNLDRAARLGLLTATSETWMAARSLRNRMVHDYIRNATLLAEAVNAAHAAIPMFAGFVEACAAYVRERQLLG